MRKYCTSDLSEAKATDKIFISKDISKYLPKKITPPKRCDYCKKILNCLEKDEKYKGTYLYSLGYCSAWCYEMEHLPKIEHTCKTCGIVVPPILRSKNRKVSSGIYYKLCRKCRINKHINWTKRSFGLTNYYKHFNLRLYPELIKLYEEEKNKRENQQPEVV